MFYHPSEKGSTLKREKMVPNGEGFRTNSFLVEEATFQKGVSVPGSKKEVTKIVTPYKKDRKNY